jgi:hypothetical protein
MYMNLFVKIFGYSTKYPCIHMGPALAPPLQLEPERSKCPPLTPVPQGGAPMATPHSQEGEGGAVGGGEAR